MFTPTAPHTFPNLVTFGHACSIETGPDLWEQKKNPYAMYEFLNMFSPIVLKHSVSTDLEQFFCFLV